jgi:hypothetical protein
VAVGITDIMAPATKAFAPIGTTLSDTWFALVGDRVSAWRLRNAAALQVAIIAQVESLGLRIDRSKVPERYALTWFEEATKQDEPVIQELFARLLARAAAGDNDALDRRHLDVLTKLTPLDARTFEWFFAKAKIGVQPEGDEYGLWRDVRAEVDADAWLSFEHLLMLALVERRFDVVKKEEGFFEPSWSATPQLMGTERGVSLFKACRPSM